MKPDNIRGWIAKVSKIQGEVSKLDMRKRALISGVGTFLAACTAPQPEQKQQKTYVPPSYIPQREDATNTTTRPANQGVECGTCPPTSKDTSTAKDFTKTPTSGGGIATNPVLPPESGSVNTNPIGSPPSGGTTQPGSGATNPIPAINAQTFSYIGPVIANLRASDMFGGITQTMSNGNSIIVWGFTDVNNASFNGDKTRLCPGPVIEMIENQPMSVQLISSHPHTLHLHGLDVDQANDGVPSTSGYVAMMRPPGAPPGLEVRVPGVNLGQTFTYRLIAPQAGTYMYHCHVDTVLHMEMGMSGTVIVRPADGSRNQLYSAGPQFDKEYIWQLHTFDSAWHAANMPPVSGSGTMRYSPDYFMINGRDGTDIAADPASAIQAYGNQKILIRLVNIGYMPAVVKLGGITFDVLCSDGRPLNSIVSGIIEWLIAPGERYDIMITMPLSGVTQATVDYLDIRGRQILGTAVNNITTL